MEHGQGLMEMDNSQHTELIKTQNMKAIILSTILFVTFLSAKAQQDTAKKEYSIKYEVLTKKGEKVNIGFFDKDGKNAGVTASEQWTYSFITYDKNQNVNLFIQRVESGMKKVWVKVNIYVNDKLIKSVEEKFMGVGPTVQVNLQDIK